MDQTEIHMIDFIETKPDTDFVNLFNFSESNLPELIGVPA